MYGRSQVIDYEDRGGDRRTEGMGHVTCQVQHSDLDTANEDPTRVHVPETGKVTGRMGNT